MTRTIARLRYSPDEPDIEVHDCHQLDEWLDRRASRCRPDSPEILRLCAHGYEVEIGLGHPESFVHVEHESGMPPYFTTVGDTQAQGEITFYLFGNHHTNIARRNLIPAPVAREVLREFFATGCRSASVQWEKET